MSIGTTLRGILWIAVALCGGGAREPPSSCDPRAQPTSGLLSIENHKRCPVYRYVVGRFVALWGPVLRRLLPPVVFGCLCYGGQ